MIGLKRRIQLRFQGIKNRFVYFCVNKLYVGTNQKFFERKRKLLNLIGHEIAEGTKVVGPLECTGKLIVGKNSWIGKNLKINGNGTVVIGNNCDIGPEVTFQTGSHEPGTYLRRAGNGFNSSITVGNGVWIGVRATILSGVQIGNGCVVGACACVNKTMSEDILIGGVPAKNIKELIHE